MLTRESPATVARRPEADPIGPLIAGRALAAVFWAVVVLLLSLSSRLLA